VSTPGSDEAWRQFLQWFEKASPKLTHLIPAAVIALPATQSPSDPEVVMVDLQSSGTIIWSRQIPKEFQPVIVAALAKSYPVQLDAPTGKGRA
jgi:hypothetical protein